MSLRNRYAWLVLMVLGLGFLLQAMILYQDLDFRQSRREARRFFVHAEDILRLEIATRDYYLGRGSQKSRERWLGLYHEIGMWIPEDGDAFSLIRHAHREELPLFAEMDAIFLGKSAAPSERPKELFSAISKLENAMYEAARALSVQAESRQEEKRALISGIFFWTFLLITFAAAAAIYFAGRKIRIPVREMLRGAGSGGEDLAVLQEAQERMSAELRQLRALRTKLERELARRIETEKMLRRSESGLRKTQAIAGLGNWEWDSLSGAMLCSDEVFEILGYEGGECDFDRFLQGIHPDDRERIAEEARVALDSGKLDTEARIVRPSGEIRIVHFSAEASGEKGKMLGSILDVSAQKRSEENLRVLNHKLERLVNESRRREREMILLRRMANKLQSCKSLEDSYAVVAESAQRMFAGMSGFLAMAKDNSLEAVANWGEAGFPAVFPAAACRAIESGGAFSWHPEDPVPACGHFSERPAGETLCLPLFIERQLFASLHFLAAENAVFGQEEYRAATAFGEILKLALTNTRLRETLSEQAVRDPLTGLFNRRYLEDALEHEIQRMRRTGSRLSVAMLDIDHFKRFNDEFGHEAGDIVLKGLASTLGEHLRKSDISCRYGGEEFTVILPESELAHAKSRLQGICDELRKKKIFHEGKPLPQVTVSIGLVEVPLSGEVEAEALLARADAALYAAKKGGRDRIEVAEDEK